VSGVKENHMLIYTILILCYSEIERERRRVNRPRRAIPGVNPGANPGVDPEAQRLNEQPQEG